MASNKESTVIIVDVGTGAEELTKKAAQCTFEVIKKKIYNHKVDMLSFLLLRTADTENVGNREEPEQYRNICQVLPGSQVPTWYMAKEFASSLGCEKSKKGDWVDALIVAIGIITEDAALHKARLSKIVLFHNFDATPSSLDDDIIAKLNEIDLKLIIVSNNIHYIPDCDGNLTPRFKAFVGKSAAQTKNEELAMQLLKVYPSTTLCNLNDALPIILRKELTRPWSWNATLTIGSRITIHISGVIAIKIDPNAPIFRKKCKDPNEIISREKKYFSGIDELTADPTQQDRITGYMLGTTPMAYDPSLGQTAQVDTKKGLYFIGFVPAGIIPQEHFSGSSTYVVFPSKGRVVSAKMMDSLVRVMLDSKLNILAWKIYNNRMKPKLVVLLPTLEHHVAGLSMIELSYHSQHRFWDFPKLTTRKNQPTADQLLAVDELMAAMELSPQPSEDQKPSDTLNRDYLPFDLLPNVREQHLIDFIASSVLKQSCSSENLMKIPGILKPKASDAADKIKTLFSLQKTEVTTKDKLKQHFIAQEDPVSSGNPTTSSNALAEDFKLMYVGTVTPAEDFTALISHVINRIPNGAERSAKFHQYACQMRSVIADLLFKSITKQNEKINRALMAYRKLTIAANSPYDYNDWMRDIRIKVVERKMFDFWEEVIVKHKLGLCMEDDAQVESDFYDLSREMAAATNVSALFEDDESVEDLFGNM